MSSGKRKSSYVSRYKYVKRAAAKHMADITCAGNSDDLSTDVGISIGGSHDVDVLRCTSSEIDLENIDLFVDQTAVEELSSGSISVVFNTEGEIGVESNSKNVSNYPDDDFTNTYEDDNISSIFRSETSESETFEFEDHCSSTSESDFENTKSVPYCNPELQPKIAKELRQWVLKHAVKQCAVNDLLRILRPHHDLPKDSRTLLETTKSKIPVVCMPDMLGNEGEYVYFGVEKQVRRNLLSTALENQLDKLDLFFNVDGLPISKSSTKQFWPILCAAVVNMKLTKPFVIALFCGSSKPASAHIFLADLVNELKSLQINGIMMCDEISVDVTVKGFICDAPARAFIKCIKGHSGFYACERCTQKGTHLKEERKMVFLDVNSPSRTGLSFRNKTQPQHHKGTSPLIELDINLVSQVPLEYMHLICIGTMRKLLLHWLEGEKRVKISAHMAMTISEEIHVLAAHICCEFARKPRSLKHVDRWKAVELRLFLGYIGPLVLRDTIGEDLYHHFMLLHVAVTILASPVYCSAYCDYAATLLQQFVQEMSELYGKSSIVYTIHSLIHVCDDVKQFGPLDSYSAFAFENVLGQIKRMLRSGNLPLRQICRRLSELSASGDSVDGSTARADGLELQSAHWQGPSLGFTGPQYKKLKYSGFTFCTEGSADCYALLHDGRVIQVVNFIEEESVKVIGKEFCKKSSFYEYPCDSGLYNICKLRNLSDVYTIVTVYDITRKCLLLPRKNYFVSFPLLHIDIHT